MSTRTTRKPRAVCLRADEVRTLRDTGAVVVRRPVKPQPDPESFVDQINEAPGWWELALLPGGFEDGGCLPLRELRCPLGAPGDRLWGKEAYGRYRGFGARVAADAPVLYRADLDHCGQCPCMLDGEFVRVSIREPWRSAATMPRWASRFPRLVVASVAVERATDGGEWEWVVRIEDKGRGEGSEK